MATVKFYLNNPKGDIGLRKDPVAIIAKFSIDRDNRINLSTRERIVPKYWNTEQQKPKSTYSGHAELNISLSKIEQDLLQLWRENKSLPFSELKEKAKQLIQTGSDSTPIQKKRNDLELFIQDFIRKCEEGKITRGKNTIQTYRATLEHLQNCAKKYNHTISFDSITLDFGYDFQEYSWETLKHEDSTLDKSIKILKMFMRESLEQKLHSNESYKRIKRLEGISDGIYLTEDEITKIYETDYSAKGRPDLIVSRDLAVYNCWIGVRYSDLKKATESNRIQNNTIRLITQKTREEVVIPLHPTAKAVIEKYNGDLPKPLSNPKFNKHLKDIAELAGLTMEVPKSRRVKKEIITEWVPKHKMVTVHTLRRSFATNCYKMGVPTRSIMAITGHTTEKSFNKYIKLSKDEHAQIMMDVFNQTFKPKMEVNAA